MENSCYMAVGHLMNSVVSFLTGGEALAIPLGQVLIFVMITSYCLLFAKYKLGLLITYCFVFYWGFISNREFIIDRFGSNSWGLILYVLVGIFMVIMFLIGCFQPGKE
ncbi:MAG TPA: hypothetical protein VEJ88_02440 [Dissulfurispiraceae bacterium]|nr:hypothetical protein [Dissulfurispiraceae bacterium]